MKMPQHEFLLINNKMVKLEFLHQNPKIKKKIKNKYYIGLHGLDILIYV
jgi:hypothetical protein